jgi:5-methyltetrahydrofolate--homocysteine methyltransferase
VRRLHDELRVKTVLGVSNVSFGLPNRGALTASFLGMAMERGLSAAIINPLDTDVRTAYDGACAALGYDDGFARYLARYSGEHQAAGTPGAETQAAREAVRSAGEAIRKAEAALQLTPSENPPTKAEHAVAAKQTPVRETGSEAFLALHQAIVRGLAGAAAEDARQLMDAGTEPLSVVEKGVIPALSDVGARYERGEFFLPQLMQSAAAAKQAIAEASARMPESKPSAEHTVLLATVHGDVHDIGKNIVATLLGSYGFGVIDLGRDVPPEKVAAAAKETGVKLVGLSALMTTTVPAMRETIQLLRREAPQAKIMVGGAVLTPELARDLGADGYSADAMGAVRYAGEVLG